MAALRIIRLNPEDQEKLEIEVKVTYGDMLKEMVKETEGQNLTIEEKKDHEKN